MECEMAANSFLTKCEYKLTASCTLLYILSSASSRESSTSRIFLPGKEGGVTFWPQGTASVLPSPDLHFKTSWRSKCRILKCCSDLCLALHRHSSRRAEVPATCIGDQAWAVDVKISYWVRYPHATSPNLSACSGLQSASFVFVLIFLWFIICCYRSWWGNSFHLYLSVLNFFRCWNTEDLIIRSHPKW